MQLTDALGSRLVARHGRRVLGLVGVLAALGLTTMLVLAPRLATAAGPEDAQTATAIQWLTTRPGHEARQAIPDDFAAVIGYEPILVDGDLVDPWGECSSPVPLPSSFEPACGEHDLGYDLLRYAAASDAPLGSWARLQLDARFAERIRNSCEESWTCTTMADIAGLAVVLNSARQFDLQPDEWWATQLLTWSVVLLAATGTGGLAGAVRSSRAGLRSASSARSAASKSV